MMDKQHPIEITIEPVAIRVWAVVALVSAGLLMGLIGANGSPLVDGHPVVLTRERLIIRDYMASAEAWLRRLDDAAVQMEHLTPTASTAMTATVINSTESASSQLVPTATLPSHVELPPETSLPVFQPPANQPANLFDQAQQGEQVMRDLQAIDAELQRLEVPAMFTGLHEIAAATLHDVAQWSNAVLAALGAPSPDNLAAIEPAHQTARSAMTTLQRAIETQQGQVR